ncbi:MAG TPA: restriction endonuclease [Micromonosporaceae bacterium]
MTRILLREAGRERQIALSAPQARRLAAARVVELRPGVDTDSWLVRAGHMVGAARIGDVEVRIAPKVPVDRLLFLMGYARHPDRWREDRVNLSEHPELVPALAGAFWRQTERALRGGLLHGYRERDDTSVVLRGRLRETDQLGRWYGMPQPLEIRHDEFTVDIPENRILLTALGLLLRTPGVDRATLAVLRQQAHRLASVTPLRRGEPPPTWQPSRINARYQPSLRLAELVLAGSSVESGFGGVTVNGFLLDMAVVFEDFVSAALRRSLQTRYGGRVTFQPPEHLDIADRISLRPDILWRRAGRVAAVVDAKYKAYTPAQDAYQMLAYCTVYGLRHGHLVYVTGDQPPIRHVVRNAGVEIVCHALDLSKPPEALLTQVDLLASRIAEAGALTAPPV